MHCRVIEIYYLLQIDFDAARAPRFLYFIQDIFFLVSINLIHFLQIQLFIYMLLLLDFPFICNLFLYDLLYFLFNSVHYTASAALRRYWVAYEIMHFCDTWIFLQTED